MIEMCSLWCAGVSQAHPNKPDILGILGILAAESGEPPYADLIAEGAATPIEKLPPLGAALAMLPKCMADGFSDGGSCPGGGGGKAS